MQPASTPDRLVVGMTGATGQIFGIRALELLADTSCDAHLVLSGPARMNVRRETDYEVAEVEALASEVHGIDNVGAAVSSGSFATGGMLVAPCSMKTLANVATGNSNNLLTRAADVVLKERRPLVLMVREKPFSAIHLENMLTVTRAGAVVVPPFLSFYRPEDTLDEMITRTVGRALSHCGVDVGVEEWEGMDA